MQLFALIECMMWMCRPVRLRVCLSVCVDQYRVACLSCRTKLRTASQTTFWIMRGIGEVTVDFRVGADKLKFWIECLRRIAFRSYTRDTMNALSDRGIRLVLCRYKMYANISMTQMSTLQTISRRFRFTPYNFSIRKALKHMNWFCYRQ